VRCSCSFSAVSCLIDYGEADDINPRMEGSRVIDANQRSKFAVRLQSPALAHPCD
jgi:hypothetical protein